MPDPVTTWKNRQKDREKDERARQASDPDYVADCKRRIVHAVGNGQAEETSAECNGVDQRTLERWKREDGDFAADLTQAFALGTARLVDASYYRAMTESDRLAEKMLGWRDPGRFGEKGVGGSGTKPLSQMTLAEIEAHISGLREQQRAAANTIDGEAVVVDRPD
jgi:hypothetical protein